MAGEQPIQPMAGLMCMVISIDRSLAVDLALRRRGMQHVVHLAQGLCQEYQCEQPGPWPDTETSRLPPVQSWTR